MKRPLSILFAAISLAVAALIPARAQSLGPPRLAIPYGHNNSAGRTIELNGIRMYLETYGTGTPVLMIHGNGDSIAAMGHQIQFFSEKYRVIAADSRGHGKSEMGAGRLTYEQMAEDANALLDKLDLKRVHVLGWSDGGIIGLLLAMNHPDKVGKLAIMGANLNPRGAEDWAYDLSVQWLTNADAKIAIGDTSEPWQTYKQYFDLLARQPNIPAEKLKNVTAPTLVMAGDKDEIRAEHTLEIFQALPRAQLCIFPGATHLIPWQNPALFNQTVDKFFREPFTRPGSRDLFVSPTNQP